MSWLNSLGSLFSAGANTYGAFQQANAAKDANDIARSGQANADALTREQLAFAKEKDARDYQLALDTLRRNRGIEDLTIKAQYAPVTNARGTVSSFDPETGWSVNLSDRERQMLDVTDKAFMGNEALRSGARDASSSFLAELMGESPYDLGSMQDNLEASGYRQMNDMYEGAVSDVARTSARQGSNSAKMLDQLAKRMLDDAGKIGLNAAIQAPQSYEQAESSRTGRLLNSFGQTSNIGMGSPVTPVQTSSSQSPGSAVAAANTVAGLSGGPLGAAMSAGQGVGQAYGQGADAALQGSNNVARFAALAGQQRSPWSAVGDTIYGISRSGLFGGGSDSKAVARPTNYNFYADPA